jgi:DNA-binding phage protein
MAAKPKRPNIKVAQYDSADYLKSEADIKNYLMRLSAQAA